MEALIFELVAVFVIAIIWVIGIDKSNEEDENF